MNPQDDPTIYQRLADLETSVAQMSGTLKTVDGKADTLLLALASMSKPDKTTGIYQKVLLAAIVVQMIVQGFINPEQAKAVISSLLTGVLK